MAAAVTGTPSTLRGTRRADNILFDRRATVEFSSSSGVLDLMRELDLDLEAAQEISDHLPGLGRVQFLRRRPARRDEEPARGADGRYERRAFVQLIPLATRRRD